MFPDKRYLALLEVLATVHRFTDFLEAFEHWQGKYARPTPPDRTFFAGIIGLGCFIGLPKIATISTRITEAELENAVHWYFSLETIQGANDRILQCMDRLELPEISRRQPGMLHTSSDGQKFEVAVESLLATYFFKYFGQRQGVSTYNFLDERHFGFHANVVSAAEREAHYVIDGLMHYSALKESGKILKSEFLLRSIADGTLRQAIEKQMNKIENANKFSRAIAFGNNEVFLYGEQVEQEMAEGCRRLIKNAIICWNYLSLTQKIADAESDERRQELLTAVQQGSVVSWQHVNLHGEYDFSDEKLQDSVGLRLPSALGLRMHPHEAGFQLTAVDR